jgi:hypothetical protein
LLVIATFVPTSAFVSVDLPALGRPTKQAKPARYGGEAGVSASARSVTVPILPHDCGDARPGARHGATNCARASFTTYGNEVLTANSGSSPPVLPDPTQVIRQ